MIELKAIEKMRNEMNALDPVPSRKEGASASSSAAAAATTVSTNKTGLPFSFSSSALEQATASFGHEAGTLASFERMQHKKGGAGGGGGGGGGRKAVLSTKARQRKLAGSAKEEAYAEKLSGRVIKSSKRKERMERLRRIY
jgi:hypothetical protein